MHRSGNVTLVGRTNVGKSTFLNIALGEPLAIVSPRPQTTRDPLLGVVIWKDAEIAIMDCPGFHRPRNELGVRMNAVATDHLLHSELVLLLTDVEPLLQKPPGKRRASPFNVSKAYAEELKLLSQIPEGTPCILVVNKVDKISNKQLLLPLLSQLSEARPTATIVPASCMLRSDVERVLEIIAPLLPEQPHRFEPDTLTDRPVRYFVAEYIRERVMHATSGEVPFVVAVSLDEFSELPSVTIVKATLCVEKEGQRIILIGHGGQKIKEIGIASRSRIEGLLKKKVHLELFVKTRKYWRNNKADLEDLGYGASRSEPLKPAIRSSERGRP